MKAPMGGDAHRRRAGAARGPQPPAPRRPGGQALGRLPPRARLPRTHRNGPTRLIAAMSRVSEALETALDPKQAAWAALVALTAGEGFGFNRAFALLVDGDHLRGWFGVGPRSPEEAAAVWGDIRTREVHPLEGLAHPDPLVIEAELARHAEMLQRLSHPLSEGCSTWRRAFIARGDHHNACVRHWLSVLGSEAIAVLPGMSSVGPGSVVLADNFVTHAAIHPARLEAAQTVVHALCAAIDRTRLIDTLHDEQRRRIAAEQATALLEKARTLAHDLKNPLALAGGLARELVDAPPPRADALFKNLRVIASAVKQAEERVEQLGRELAAQVPTVTLGALDVGEVVERLANAFRPLAEGRGIRLVCYRPSRRLLAVAEPSLLERCLENLVGNGLQVLREERTAAPVLRIAVFSRGEHVEIEVSDNGPPLPGQLRQDPFAGAISSHRAGTGLGLISVRRLVDAMGGRVEYDEREPGWVRFTVSLRRVP